MYIYKFLKDIRFGTPLIDFDENEMPADLSDEISIYNYLVSNKCDCKQIYGVADVDHLDMLGLDNLLPIEKQNIHAVSFSESISVSVEMAVELASKKSYVRNDSKFDISTLYGKAASWFISSYPLLGGLAASFKIIDDKRIANVYDISVAAIDVQNREILINPVCKLSYDEWKFVLAHEYLHAGLCHEERCQGRNKYLWNVACDFVINLWLSEMKVGVMPKIGILYDESLNNKSTEEVYDEITMNLKKSKNFETFRGDGIGDIIGSDERPVNRKNLGEESVTLDEFCKNALRQGLEYHKEKSRGYLPAGLEEEIKALSMPAIPWDVELANWFERYFSPIEKHRSYARPSRRQSSTPDIPRPRTIPKDSHSFRTFGVIVDTSGSMSAKHLGMALGSIASYANAKDVEQVRVVFCDASAYDVGYLTPEDIAGRVVVKGRGGTILQPAVNLLEKAKDFPKKAPILIITDGYIESDLSIKSEHAFLIPRGNTLPFKARGDVFYYSDK
jgi:predicted metal-dependent peptidase